ncbi:MAG: hypothetical protein ACYDIE_09525, partial [Candidatus Krumholzibacteriia bacterium]
MGFPRFGLVCFAALGLGAAARPAAAPAAGATAPPPASSRPGGALYKPAYRYPVLERIEARRDSLRALADSATARIDARH